LLLSAGVLAISGVKILGSHITTGLGTPSGRKSSEEHLRTQLAECRALEADLLQKLKLNEQMKE
jgi:hypothetical protein